MTDASVAPAADSRERRRFTALIVGGGPAGAALALALARRGGSVLVTEVAAAPVVKTGECLPPSATPYLRDLNVWDNFMADKHLPSFGNRSSWGSEVLEDRQFIYEPYGVGWHLDRRRFDATLVLGAIAVGAEWWNAARVLDCQRRGDSWRVAIVVGGTVREVCADVLVDATGRRGWVARRLGVRRKRFDRLVGVAAVLAADRHAFHNDAATLVEATPDGWWYAALLPDRRVAVTFMSDADLVAHRRAHTVQGWWYLLQQTRWLRQRMRLTGDIVDCALAVRCCQSTQLCQPAGEGWVAIGDAAATYDPLSSHGIESALSSAAHAEEYVRQPSHSALRAYTDWLAQTYVGYRAQHAAYHALERRWSDAPFWHRRTQLHA